MALDVDGWSIKSNDTAAMRKTFNDAYALSQGTPSVATGTGTRPSKWGTNAASTPSAVDVGSTAPPPATDAWSTSSFKPPAATKTPSTTTTTAPKTAAAVSPVVGGPTGNDVNQSGSR